MEQATEATGICMESLLGWDDDEGVIYPIPQPIEGRIRWVAPCQAP